LPLVAIFSAGIDRMSGSVPLPASAALGHRQIISTSAN